MIEIDDDQERRPASTPLLPVVRREPLHLEGAEEQQQGRHGVVEEAPELVTAQLLDVGVLVDDGDDDLELPQDQHREPDRGPCFLRNLRHKNNGNTRK